MNADITLEDFLVLVKESCKYRALKEYVGKCHGYINDDVVRALLGVEKEVEENV